jgi:hypothetical protein
MPPVTPALLQSMLRPGSIGDGIVCAGTVEAIKQRKRIDFFMAGTPLLQNNFFLFLLFTNDISSAVPKLCPAGVYTTWFLL